MELTRNDIKKMEEEIAYRKGALRQELLENLKSARAQGDLSENYEYVMAKRANNQNNGRIQYLERLIRTAKIVEDHPESDAAGLNKTVTILIVDEGTEETYKLVSVIRGDSLSDRITLDCPIGKALNGHRAGDRVTVKVNDAYSYDVIIKKVVATPDDGSDPIRQY